MKIGSVCNPEVAVIEPHELVVDAARRMRERHVGDLVVVRNEPGGRVPIGILTDRDIVVGIIAKDIAHLGTLKVDDVITSDPICAKDSDDLSLVLDKMRRNVIRRVPVVNARGYLAGVFTLDDLLALLADDLGSVGAIVSRQRTFEAERRKV
jgi:CBS domain-containing protein